MSTCTICRFQTEADDVAVPMAGSRCICLRCFTRETETAHPMPKELRRQLDSLLAAA